MREIEKKLNYVFNFNFRTSLNVTSFESTKTEENCKYFDYPLEHDEYLKPWIGFFLLATKPCWLMLKLTSNLTVYAENTKRTGIPMCTLKTDFK
jgi:hypothetical protein